MKKQFFLKEKPILLFFVLFCLFFSFKTEAAILYFESSFNEYYLNDIFLVHLKIDTEKEKINAAKIEINFPKDKLELIDITKEDSIFVFWPEEPSLKYDGKISFVGGLPLGFIGKGKILSIAFKAISKVEGKIEIEFDNECLVLLSDGFGTRAKLVLENFNLYLFPFESPSTKDELKKILQKDNISPEPFQIILTKDPLIFEGKYFISFFTIDLQSGISHYEIKEGQRPWKKTKYNFWLLEDQTLKSEIKVKAVDKAGNETISVLKLF